jgi:hypothetical protein
VSNDTDVEARTSPLSQMQVWEAMTANADVVEGGDLEKGDALIGIAFAIALITIQPGDNIHGTVKDGKLIPGTGCGAKHPYASLSATVGPEELIARAVRRKRITEEQASAIEPLEQIVFNEGGTGAYRNVMQYLEAKNFVIFPDAPEQGEFGESRYDALPSQWIIPDTVSNDIVSQRFSPTGEPFYTFRLPVPLLCPRGLRISEYDGPTGPARTRYLA